MKLLDKILKAGDGKRLKAAQSVVAPVAALEADMQALSDAELRAKTDEFKRRLDNGAGLDDLIVESFAVAREASVRVFDKRPYDVQIMGGAALHWGWAAEMKTGEGKTLVATLPVYLNALAGKGVHVVTVNDYLASRDAEEMGRVYNFLGQSVGLVVPGNNDSAHKREQYGRDITHGTNNEFGFDYLRDNMARSRAEMVQRGHNFVIVDEIDSILIDEARTPLIISGKVRGAQELYNQFADVAKRMRRDVDYEVDEEKRIVAILDEGINHVEELLQIENLYDGVQGDLIHQLNAALRAKELFKKDKDYLIQNGEVKIVDEFTGRVLDGRRWSDGLHQAVEAKEKVAIKEEQQTLATVTLQNYFRMYDKLAGMTGTALGDAAELEATYNLAVVQIPTNKPLIRKDEADYIYKTELGKFNAVVDDLEERVAAGQPVLVGTASVEKSEKLAGILTQRGVEHEVLNAKQHFREADIVAQAGKPGAVTVATNMAGRGVDIILGGNAEKLAEGDTRAKGLDPEDNDEGRAYFEERLEYWQPICDAEGDRVREAGGLYVLATERHESRRIDDQLRGRSGRQGDPGESRFYLSLEDDLMRIFATGAMNFVMDRALPEGIPIESKMVSKSVERAQNTVEQRNAEQRKNVLKYDEVFNEQRKIVYARRLQVLDQGDLKEDTIEAIGEVAEVLVRTHCVEELDDTWDLDALVTELKGFWPTELDEATLGENRGTAGLIEMIAEEGEALYLAKEEELGSDVLRAAERQIMLQMTDQRWREHLTEMDYLREGINLRAMGQRDPLTEWQREGFELFSQMMTALQVDFVRYVMHVQVKAPEPIGDDVSDVSTSKEDVANAEAKAGGVGTRAAAPKLQPKARPKIQAPKVVATDIQAAKADARSMTQAAREAEEPQAPAPVQQTVVNDEYANTGRNEPCPCESGRKYKHCHGK